MHTADDEPIDLMQLSAIANSITATGEYVAFGKFYSTMDGRFSAAELRAIADVMDRIPDATEAVEFDPLYNRERRG